MTWKTRKCCSVIQLLGGDWWPLQGPRSLPVGVAVAEQAGGEAPPLHLSRALMGPFGEAG